MDKEQRYAYFMEWKREMDADARIFFAETKGEARGEIKGKLEVAKNLLSENIAPDVVARNTGLSLEEIQNLMK
jgi:predicted transposase/invertase (TIGR01784 family)